MDEIEESRLGGAVALLDGPELDGPELDGPAVDAPASEVEGVAAVEPVAAVEAVVAVEPVVETELAGAEPAAEAGAVAVEPAVEEPVVEAEPVAEVESVEAEPVAEVESVEPVEDVEPVVVGTLRPARRRMSLRRRIAVGAVVLVGALTVSAFARVGPAGGTADQHFVDTARAQGHVLAGGRQQTLLLSAARKICGRRQSHSTVAERHATALSTDELTAIQRIFSGDNRGFTVLALSTYCSS